MEEFYYRFRSIEKLLGPKFQELEKQVIYFTLPTELNDPMEGFKDIFWSGDDIVWKNFIRHYLLCLGQVCTIFVLGGEKAKISDSDNWVFLTEDELKSDSLKEIYWQICDVFFKDKNASKYPSWLASHSRPIRRSELLFYLDHLHAHALNSIFSIYAQHGLVKAITPEDPLSPFLKREVLDPNQFDVVFKSTVPEQDERFFIDANNSHLQARLASRYNNLDKPYPQNRLMVFAEFSERYLKALERVIHPPWHTACFVANAGSPSMWAHYADGHRGICLKFKASQDANGNFIKLRGINGIGGGSKETKFFYGDLRHDFHKVKYQERFPEVDFFRTLGRLSHSALSNFWYRGENGKFSACSDGVLTDKKAWRSRYWEAFYSSITTKLLDWSYEEEYRLVGSELLLSKDDPEHRTLRYNFQDLDGLIFGINTSEQDKLDIFKIIEAKCRSAERKDFNFYQAAYSRGSGKIEVLEMKSLNFSRNETSQ